VHEEVLKRTLKAAYLLQLKRGHFAEQELVDVVDKSEFQQALNAGYVITKNAGGEKHYSLSDQGRSRIKVVLAGGVYDVLHLGHLAALSEARSLGDVLVAVVATDATVRLLKGRNPIFPQEDRLALVEGLKPVDRAILGYEDIGFGFEQILSDVLPDIVAFGFDQENLEKTVRKIIERRKLSIQMVKLSRFDHEQYLSSTSIRQKLSEEMR
jgi:cytidyltransferase-like protein